MAAPKRKEKPLNSLIAGTISGAVEGFATYPTEFVKTRAQFAVASGSKPPGPIEIVRTTLAQNGVRGLYSGCSALVVGNAAKAGVRFLSYDSIKLAVADKTTGQLSLPRSILAGFIAGISEGLFAVTPSEAIKTRLIEDGRKPKAERRYHGLFSGSAQILREEGLAGVYRGLGPTMIRQGANSAVRLTTYSTLRGIATKDGRKTSSVETFGMGAIAGIVTVYCTMPLDVVKTRMQSAEASKNYTGTLNCAVTMFKNEGLRRFWKGTTPRLTRLILSGGIVFTIYENTLALLDKTEQVAKEKVAEVKTHS
ncbi:mitochondrial tricarboxylate transporter [Microstroma glucosiphilum]|uniref:Mitochondrial tricarboxylate transporter n=1 Tax=Pseudomicrostroma glucosiphilum TaxID=1684307 RepID=A0A316UG40_9BASI|nr:mitochondrial tricarboxylate transporter [Pseudomicrostroma glucosiphilum]PWN23874.1 mitochondrial tricarboxylate transporter [Pseudomicrostroma glucosiphilum]